MEVCAVKGLFGAAFDIGGNAEDDDTAGAGVEVFAFVEVNGLFGAVVDIGGKAAALEEEDNFSSFFATALPKLKPDDAGVLLADVLPNPEKGLGAAVDIGGNADDDATGAGALVEVNGLFGAALDIGGNADEDAAGAGALVDVKGLFGAVLDIGGNAEDDDGVAAFPKGFLGASFDIGGKAELTADAGESSFFDVAKVKPPDDGAAAAAAVVDAPPNPNENPPVAVAEEVVEVSSFFWAAKLKPVAAGTGAGVPPPNENPPEPILLVAAAADPPPNENPLAPMLPADEAALAEGASATLPWPSWPGLVVSQAAHTESDALFVTMQTSHFHEPSSEALNSPPQPFALPESPSFAASAPFSVSTTALSSSDSSSLSPSPNNQSIYQSRKALRVITLSLLESPTLLIFLIVRLCSSSQ